MTNLIIEILFLRVFSDIPVPKPVHFFTGVLKRAQDIAVADVVFDMPISPSINKSHFFGIELYPNCIADNVSLRLIAFSSEKSFVGLSSFIGITDSAIFDNLHNWFIAAPPLLKFFTICSVTSDG